MENKDIKTFIKQLNNPPSEYSAIPFWFINDNFSKQKISEQIVDMKRKGIDIVIPHPRMGFDENIEYLSKEFFDVMEYIVTTAEQNDMKIILYDEGMYPSGSAGGLITRKNPKLKAKGIFLSDGSEGKTIVSLPQGKIVYSYSGGRIRGIHFGEDDGEENQPYAADILNPEAVKLFIEYTHEAYYQRLKKYFGNTIIGFFTDEPDPKGRCGTRAVFAWYDGLETDILKESGSLEDLIGLFEDKENSTIEIYKRLIKRREAEVYYKPIKEWCNSHNIALCGHPSDSDDVTQLLSFDIPGQDLVYRFVSTDTGDLEGVHSVLGKLPPDIASILGVKRVMCETFGCCGKWENSWDLPPEEMKYLIDYLGVRGTNMFVLHAFFYSLRGKRKYDRPPDVGINTEWWEDAEYFLKYIKRVSFLMSGVKMLNDVYVSCSDGKVPYQEVRDFYQNQIQFCYLPLELYKLADNKEILGFNADFSVDRFLPLRSLYFENYQPNIRVCHFIKDGIEAYFVVNTSSMSVSDNVVINNDANIIMYDLWSGQYYTPTRNKEGKFRLNLNGRSSVAIFIDKANQVRKIDKVEPIQIEVDFKLLSESINEKVYEAKYTASNVCGSETISLKAEETVRWFVNGKKVNVTFWNDHSCNIGRYLVEGENSIRIVVRGSTSNIYGDKKVEFGLF